MFLNEWILADAFVVYGEVLKFMQAFCTLGHNVQTCATDFKLEINVCLITYLVMEPSFTYVRLLLCFNLGLYLVSGFQLIYLFARALYRAELYFNVISIMAMIIRYLNSLVNQLVFRLFCTVAVSLNLAMQLDYIMVILHCCITIVLNLWRFIMPFEPLIFLTFVLLMY